MLLSSIIFLPLVSAVLLAVLPREGWLKQTALLLSLVQLVFVCVLISWFDHTSPALQFMERREWIRELGISYFVGVDGISLWLIALTGFLLPIVILGSWTSISDRVRSFLIALFALQTAMLGSFLAMDGILFYVFFELSLVPMAFIVALWGGDRRHYATLKFFIYTMAGSILMLVGMIYLMFTARDTIGALSANVLDWYRLKLPFVAGEWMNPQTLLFLAFSLAFAIKVPMFPVHTWLPDAHVEAPTPGSVVLAGVMLKMGTYGFLRFVIPLFPEAAEHYAWIFLFLAVIGIIYGALVAMVQPDLKKLVAYSSVSHMGYVVLGLFSLNGAGLSGGVLQMLNHGVSTGALFLLVGMIYERTHSRKIADYGGLAPFMPLYTIAFIIITLSSIAVPLTNGFIGEFLILFGAFQREWLFAAVASLGVVLGAAYMLWAVKRIFFGPPGPILSAEHGDGDAHSASPAGHSAPHSHGSDEVTPLSWLPDLSLREKTVLIPLIIAIFAMGLFPSFFLRSITTSVDHLLKNRDAYQIGLNQEIKGTVSLANSPIRPLAEKSSENQQ